MPFVSPKALCRRLALTPKKALGQHFLLHPEQAQRIVTALNLSGQETVVEIGAGLGALTFFLSQVAGRVVALELDGRLVDILHQEIVPGIANVQVINQDVLEFDFVGLSQTLGQSLSVTGNLPYQITTPLLFKLISAKAVLQTMVFMVQREVGERLLARPGGKDYGILSVLLQYHADIERIFYLSPGNFYPAPQVESLVLRLTPRLAIPPAQDETQFTQIVKTAFATRRKTLKNSLAARAVNFQSSPEAILTILDKLGIDPQRRAETLRVEDFVGISNALTE